jgi:hypothetical protein
MSDDDFTIAIALFRFRAWKIVTTALLLAHTTCNLGIKRAAGWLDRWREADQERKQLLASIGSGKDLTNSAIHLALTGSDAKEHARLRLYAKLLQEEVPTSAQTNVWLSRMQLLECAKYHKRRIFSRVSLAHMPTWFSC